MKKNNKSLLPFLIFVMVQTNCFGQDIWLHGKSRKTIGENSFIVYVDTLTLDTLFAYDKAGQRILKSKENIELIRTSMGGSRKCSCELRKHGMWIERYRSGTLKEIGEHFCNQKVGTWTYFYENGFVQKIETYQLPYLEFLTENTQVWDTLENREYLRTGLYAEYYKNESLRVEGTYEIIEEFSNTDTLIGLDTDTYEYKKTVVSGQFWLPKSVKTGLWKEFDENGKILYIKNIHPLWDSDDKYRSITSRYYEFFINEEK